MSKIEYRIDETGELINVVAIEYRPVAEVIGTFSSKAHADRFLQSLGGVCEPEARQAHPQNAEPKRRGHSHWTPEEDALLRKLNAAGWLPREMVKHFPNRTRQAVALRRNTLGLPANGTWRDPFATRNGHAAAAE